MPKKNDNSKAKRSNRLIGTRTLYSFLFIVVVAIIVLISKNLYESKVEEYKSNIYKKLSSNIVDKFDVMLHEKMNTSILISSSLSKNTNIKKALMTNNTARLNMSKLLDEMKTSKEYVDIQAELIDADGISFKRSWTHHSGDDLVENDPKLAHLIKYPRVSTDIDASSYGLTISNKIPIYDNEDFLGLFGVNIHFDALVDIFSNEGFNSVIILNKDDSKKIFQEISYSKKFVGDCYVVNSNADDYLVKIIKNNLTDYCGKVWDENYKINESTDHLVTYYSIKDASGVEIAKAIIFKSIEQIDFEDLEFIEQTHIIATAIIIVLFGFLINYLYVVRAIKELKIENEELLHENNDLQTKTDEMDFNDKKLENLFNMQPNLMFMHNGREVTKANKRFMGFFNRFGTFDGFKKKHKCVSELFEEYKAPNYIWEQKIDNLFWIEYMLKNPRRLYKTVMSINGEPHHFIIKFNEMEYAQHVAERLIIVALVDMTQDLVNYKTLDESSQVLNMLGNNLELKEEKGNTDISYELQEQISLTLSDLTKKEITEKQIIKSTTQGLKGHNVIKVQGVLRFTDVESDWMFFIPAETASKILNYMMGDSDARTEGNVTKDNIDTARELISIISAKLCNEINNKNFHDLKDARYTESTIHEVSKKEIDTLENIYKIKVKLDDDFEVEFFTTFLDDIVPFLQQAANEKTIEVPKKEVKLEEKEPEKIEKAVEEPKEEKKEIVKKTKEIKPKIKQKTRVKKETPKKPVNMDANSLIQESFVAALKQLIPNYITNEKFSLVKKETLVGKNFIETDNKFILLSNNKEINWSMVISAETLSRIDSLRKEHSNIKLKNNIDSDLEAITKDILFTIAMKVAENTQNNINFDSSELKKIDSTRIKENIKLYDIGLVVDGVSLPIYIHI